MANQTTDMKEAETRRLASERAAATAQRESQALIRKLQAEKAQSASKRNVLKADIKEGREFGKDVLGEEGLGRLGTDTKVQETLSRFEDLSKGTQADELAASRSQAFQGIDQQQQTQSRSLQAALARSGVKGGAAGAQQRELALGGLQTKAGVERDLLLSDASSRSAGLKDFANAAGQVKQFDLAQSAAEKNIELSSGLGFAQISASERGAKLAADAQRQAAAAKSSGGCFGPTSLVVMADGSTKEMRDVMPGDITSKGKVLGYSRHLVESDYLVDYDGIVVTERHPINDNGVWKETGTTEEALSIIVPNRELLVCDIFTEEFRIEIQGKNGIHEFTDYEGVDIAEINREIIKGLNESV